MVEFRLERPAAVNDDSGDHWLQAALRIGVLEDDWDGQPITISLRGAALSVLQTSYQVTNNVLIGEPEKLPHPHFQRQPGGAEITGPKNAAGFLDGAVLGEAQNIASIRPANPKGEPLTAQIVARNRDIHIALAGEALTPEQDTRNTVLKVLLLSETRADERGRIILSRQRMARKPE